MSATSCRARFVCLCSYQPEEVLGQPVELMLNMVYPERNPLTYIRQRLSNGHPYRSEELIYSKFQQPAVRLGR
ncbi:hypothetical protein [Pseudomonas fluorescens]|uniref:hypothetical protein n=1 Tax=Pseudomonas fluorescens TaxID=294 RepID=UPI0003138410|nr:hypothetical protein [Pseudomonas fluorescens]